MNDLSLDTFQTVLDADGLVLVDFHADWCGPCLMLQPVLDEVVSENEGTTLFGVDIDNNPELASKYGVSSIPCVIFFRNGKEVERVVGLRRSSEFSDLISKHSDLNAGK